MPVSGRVHTARVLVSSNGERGANNSNNPGGGGEYSGWNQTTREQRSPHHASVAGIQQALGGYTTSQQPQQFPQPATTGGGAFNGMLFNSLLDSTLPASSAHHHAASDHEDDHHHMGSPSSTSSAIQMTKLGDPLESSTLLARNTLRALAVPPNSIGIGISTPGSGASSPSSPGSSSANWKLFDQGMRFGCMLSLLAWVMWDAIVDARLRPADQNLWIQLVLPVYRGLGCVVLLGWCWGCSLYVWERYHINYPFLLELDASRGASNSIMPYTDVLDECVNVTIVFLANFLLYFKIMRGDFPPWLTSGYLPVLFLAYMVWKCLPLGAWLGCSSSPSSNRNAPLWAGLGQVPLAPCAPRVTFLAGYMGDVWTSVVKVSVDLAYAMCFVLSGTWKIEMDTLAAQQEATFLASQAATSSSLAMAAAAGLSTPAAALRPPPMETCFTSLFFKRALIPLLSALPLWFRFMQCLRRYLLTRQRWPHIGNACKYALSHSVVLFGVFNSSALAGASVMTSTYKAGWILCMVLSTLYTYWWDVVMDWGLGSWKHGLLREERLYPSRLVYYGAMIIDLFMRFAWTVTLVPTGADSPLPEDFMVYMAPMLASGEILRRTMWGFFRLEWEHICTQQFHRKEGAPQQSATLTSGTDGNATMSGTKVIVEVAVLVVMVLSVGITAALSAN
jgi:hypothetical protein